MNPRTILIIALSCFALANIGYWHNKMRPKAQQPPGATVITAQGETNRYPDLRGAMAAANVGDLVYPDGGIHFFTVLAHAHRTNRVLPDVREAVNTNRFPLEDAP